MRADPSFVASGVPEGTYCRGISDAREQYALYIHHSGAQLDVLYRDAGQYSGEALVLDIPRGTYKAEWVEPALGSVLGPSPSYQGSNQVLSTPEYQLDIALRIKCIH